MKKKDVQIGSTYIVKVSGVLAKVRISGELPCGGWRGTNLATGREIRIGRRPACAVQGTSNPIIDVPGLLGVTISDVLPMAREDAFRITGIGVRKGPKTRRT